MEKPIISQIKDNFKEYYIIWCSLLIFFIIIAPYFYLFSLKLSLTGLSHSQEKWGQFGDYIGGILNPVLQFIILFMILKDHKLAKNQLRFDESKLYYERLNGFYRKVKAAFDEFKIAVVSLDSKNKNRFEIENSGPFKYTNLLDYYYFMDSFRKEDVFPRFYYRGKSKEFENILILLNQYVDYINPSLMNQYDQKIFSNEMEIFLLELINIKNQFDGYGTSDETPFDATKSEFTIGFYNSVKNAIDELTLKQKILLGMKLK
ncbi:MAG: hypothetical protein LCH54_02240 [Bacteroidetes bacterium]|nr:hypothetical protein [Bacteroidota bacterium]